MRIDDLGLLKYTDAWAVQEAAHAEVSTGGEERLLLVEHPPVITYGRRPGVDKNLLASTQQLKAMGVEIVQSDRGGDITFHGPGQLVVYPIIRLANHGLSVSGYVHLLEAIIIAALDQFGVPANTDPTAVGVWTEGRSCGLAKVCAIGIRIRRGGDHARPCVEREYGSSLLRSDRTVRFALQDRHFTGANPWVASARYICGEGGIVWPADRPIGKFLAQSTAARPQ